MSPPCPGMDHHHCEHMRVAPLAAQVPLATKQAAAKVAAAATASALADYFAAHLMYAGPGDLFESEGRALFERQAAQFVARGEPVGMVLPAFPFKSVNTVGKTLGALPDKGEELALANLHDFCEGVKRDVYAPGCVITIVSDGRVYADLLRVTEEHVEAYDAEIRRMADSCNIGWDYLDAMGEDQCAALMQKYGVTIEAVHNKLHAHTDPNFNAVYCGFIIFVNEDLFQKPEAGMSRNEVKRRCRSIARQMMARNEAYSAWIRERYPDHIRLSIHGHNNNGPKFAIRLLGDVADWSQPYNNSRLPTPWQNATVDLGDGQGFRVMRRRAIEERWETELVYFDSDADGARPSHLRVLRER